jgi:Fe-S cluster assembly ATPase SufC
MLEPKLAILDETDSGLDIDALRVVAKGSTACAAGRAIIVVTHYQRLLDYIVPDYVHVLPDGPHRAHGGKELALELEDGWVTQRLRLAQRRALQRRCAGAGAAAGHAGSSAGAGVRGHRRRDLE